MNATKKTNKRRLLSLLLMICMVFTLLPVTVFAEDSNEAIIGVTEHKYLRSAVLDMLRGNTLLMFAIMNIPVTLILPLKM